jgi:hypothetical protein
MDMITFADWSETAMGFSISLQGIKESCVYPRMVARHLQLQRWSNPDR